MNWLKNIPESYNHADIDVEYGGLLPVGYVDSEGGLHRIVKFRPDGIIGDDEHKMADNKFQNNGAKAMTALLGNGLVESIGEVKVNADVIRRLTSADRDYLLLRASQITFGTEEQREFDWNCTNQMCKSAFVVYFNIDEDIEVTYLADEVARDKSGYPSYELELPLGLLKDGVRQTKVKFRLPIGSDSERLAPVARQNMSEANTSLMQMIISNIGDYERIDNKILGKMSTKDRHFFNKYLSNLAPGPKFKLEITCPTCGTTMEVPIPTKAFLSE